MSEPLLVVDRLAAAYGDVRAVQEVSLEVGAGQIHALLGRNGAGKTTTLAAIAGLVSVVRGSVRLDGKEISQLPAHKRSRLGVALIQDNRRIFRERLVDENLMLGAYATGHRRKDLAEHVELAYQSFPALRDRRKVRAGNLSGGQQQMLAIAQALVSSPRVLLLDEPSAGLAPRVVDEIFKIIVQLRDTGLAIVLAEQMIDRTLAVADQVSVVEGGRVEYHEVSADGEAARMVIQDLYLGTVKLTEEERA
jgi:branched-chain amino acid transport system ATP-binding protein